MTASYTVSMPLCTLRNKSGDHLDNVHHDLQAQRCSHFGDTDTFLERAMAAEDILVLVEGYVTLALPNALRDRSAVVVEVVDGTNDGVANLPAPRSASERVLLVVVVAEAAN
ncbi:Hypothetical protein D9617_3g018440 [Elsinoe fawcettii]|nr:Hypothetical protein D9617_3g018440 [Elsinoe fawcettii]